MYRIAKPIRRSFDAVRLGAVHELDVMQRHLAGLEQDRHGLRLLDVDRDLLTAREQVVLVEGVDMGQLVAGVRAGNHLHAAADEVAARERDPRGDDVVRLEPPVGGVLVPGDETGIGRFLDEEIGRPAQDVRADHVLHRIDDLRVVNQLVRPGEQQVRLVAPVALQRLALDGLVRFERHAVVPRVVGGHDAHRGVVAVALVAGDRVVGEQLGHRSISANRVRRMISGAMPAHNPAMQHEAGLDAAMRPGATFRPALVSIAKEGGT